MRFHASILFGVLCALCIGSQGSDWPQFRGPNRDNICTETNLLEIFPTNGLKILWKQTIGGGFSSPVVANGKVYVHDVELVQPSKERVHCFDGITGKPIWRFAYDEPYGEWAFVPERGAGPTATPIVENDRIYAVGANGWTHCLDANTGAVIWQKNIGREYQVAEMSCRPSPLIDGPRLIVFTGAKPNASVMALDKNTGKEIWKTLDDPVSNSSPMIFTVAGQRQLIVWSDSALTGLDPATGQTLWRELMTTSNNDSIATPLLQANRLLVSGLMLELTANPPAAKFLWPEIRTPTKRILSNTSTPLFQGDYIYSARGNGDLVCLDAATGKELWTTNGLTASKLGASIQITSQGNGAYLFTDEGNLIRAQVSPSGYREISRTHLVDPTWPFNEHKFVYAPPAFANTRIYARNEGQIVCASLAKN